jgi:peptidoglycan/xylan/chitin deacetylase (PgdA/CDA1 family)
MDNRKSPIGNYLYATPYTLYALFIFALLATFCAQIAFAGSIVGWGGMVTPNAALTNLIAIITEEQSIPLTNQQSSDELLIVSSSWDMYNLLFSGYIRGVGGKSYLKYSYFGYPEGTRVVYLTGEDPSPPFRDSDWQDRDPDWEAPVGLFVNFPEIPFLQDVVIFDASSSYDPDGQITKYRWFLGDGNEALGEVISHTYTEAKDYVVSLLLRDNDGLATIVERTIKIKARKEFMLTFDDGPVPGNTKNIVDALKNVYVDGKPVRAGFFMVGCDSSCKDTGAPRDVLGCLLSPDPYKLDPGCGWLSPFETWRNKGSVHGNEDIVRYVADANVVLSGSKHFINHVIGNHTQHHMWFWYGWPLYKSAVIDEIEACNAELESALGKTPLKIFRPPYFVDNWGVRGGARELHYQVIMGAGDNRGAAVDTLASSVLDVEETACDLIQKWRRDEPCVLVFHDISPITPNNITEIIKYLREKEGFTLVHFDPNRLSKEPDSVVHHDTNTIHQSEIVTHTVSLDSTVSTATFNISWGGSDLDLVLYKPDGTKIDPNSALADPNIKYAERDTYEYYTVSDPNPGNWIMEVSGLNVPPEGEKYTIRVEADTNLALFAFIDKPAYGLNEQIYITAELVNDENSVTGALVTAKVQRPDGSIDGNLILYDDGTHGDKDPNDGFYANAYNNTSLRGSYEITVSAIGDLTGDQYERASSLTVMVGSVIYGEMSITKFTVTAGSKDNSDKISISGNMDATADDFNSISVIEVTVDSNDMVNPCVQTFPINETTFKKGKYKCSKTENSSKTSFTFDTKTSKFSFTAKNVDLSGLGCPLTIEIEIGDYTGAAEVNEAIVNSKKPIPMKLMRGVKNSLRVDKIQAKHGNKPDSDQLSVKGGFAVTDTGVNLAAVDFVVGLASQTFTIPAGSFTAKKGVFTCKNIKLSGGEIANAGLNLNTCVFTMTIKNTEIVADAGVVDFGLEFADFDESVPVVLP